MVDMVPLKDLLEYTRDGEWGKGEAGEGLVEMGVIRGTDFSAVRYGDLSTVPRRFIPEQIASRKMLQAGDILIETAGGTKDVPTGRTVYISEKRLKNSTVPMTCASFSRFLRVNRDAIDPRYLFWYLQAIYDARLILPYHIQHTGVARFQYTDFAASWNVPVPSRDHQNAIAETLNALDDKIELNLRMNETLEAMAQAIFRDWFVDFGPTRRKMAGVTNPLEIMGGLVMDTERAQQLADLFPANLGDDGLPEGWKTEPLAKEISVKRGGSPRPIHDYISATGLPWVKIADASRCNGPNLFETREFIKKDGLNKTVQLNSGSLILSNSATPGLPRFLRLDACIHDGWLYFPSLGALSQEFLYLFFLTFKERLLSNATGSVFSNLKTDTLKNFEFANCGKGIYRNFDKTIRPLFELILVREQESRTLAATRDLLLPKLMSGEIRIKDAEAIVEAAQ